MTKSPNGSDYIFNVSFEERIIMVRVNFVRKFYSKESEKYIFETLELIKKWNLAVLENFKEFFI